MEDEPLNRNNPKNVFGQSHMLGARTHKHNHFLFQTLLEHNNKNVRLFIHNGLSIIV